MSRVRGPPEPAGRTGEILAAPLLLAGLVAGIAPAAPAAAARIGLPGPASFTTKDVLSGMAATSVSNAWAVGGTGGSSARTLIERWNGTAWKRVPSPSPAGGSSLYGVAATSARNAWAVGNTGSGNGTLILHWNGTAWKRVPSPCCILFGVAATARSAWAVGTTVGTKALILRWNGTAWKRGLQPALLPLAQHGRRDISERICHTGGSGSIVDAGGDPVNDETAKICDVAVDSEGSAGPQKPGHPAVPAASATGAHDHGGHAVPEAFDQAFWDELYHSRSALWSGKPNGQLVAEAGGLTPGAALDVGCGEGADAIWLAGRGWRVTAVDISSVALQRAAAQAGQAGVDIAARIEWLHEDLMTWDPGPARFDLVSAQYMQLPSVPRLALFARLAAAVAPGGTLLIVGHHPSDLQTTMPRPPLPDLFFTGDDIAASLDTRLWAVITNAAPGRTATDPEGSTVTIRDTVLRALKHK